MRTEPIEFGRFDLMSDSDESANDARRERLIALMAAEVDFVWRSLRRLGVPEGAVDDAAQQVWLILARRLPQIVAGSERSFLFGTVLRTASDFRRRYARRREDVDLASHEARDPSPGADELIERRQARSTLDEILDALPEDLRIVFVLYELEEQTAAQIAELLSIPAGTVASRVRRARAVFDQVVKRLKARGRIQGGR